MDDLGHYPCDGHKQLDDGRVIMCGKPAVAFPVRSNRGYCPDHIPEPMMYVGAWTYERLLAACKALIAADGPTGLSFAAAQIALRLAREAVAKAEGREA